MSAVDFSKLNRLTAKSFNDQKATIKKVLQGRIIKCAICKQTLVLLPPKQNQAGKVCCKNGCTDIELDMS